MPEADAGTDRHNWTFAPGGPARANSQRRRDAFDQRHDRSDTAAHASSTAYITSGTPKRPCLAGKLCDEEDHRNGNNRGHENDRPAPR